LERYFAAMRAGPDGIEDLVAPFTDDAEYIEPFSGQARVHRGRVAIEAMLRQSQANPPARSRALRPGRAHRPTGDRLPPLTGVTGGPQLES
jgi:hypothetical protein